MENGKYIAYIGTYTYGDSKGIYKLTLNENNSTIENIEPVSELAYPTYLTINKNNTHLYSVAKNGVEGGAYAFEINPIDYSLKALNHNFKEGKSPCHIILDKNDNYLFTSNYHEAELISYKIASDGSIEKAVDTVIHSGDGPNKPRQDSAHIHFADLTPNNKYIYTIDLGLDKVSLYKLKDGYFKEVADLNITPGSGPRHMEFHPNGAFSYLLNELSSKITVLKYHEDKPYFEEVEYISMLPADCSVESTGAAIHISSNGDYLYASNRGHDSITVFKVDSVSGKLTFVSNTKLQGQSPRDFSISPSGKFLLAANQTTSNVELYSINQLTGELTYLNISEHIPNPVCIKFLNQAN
ncbi:lactonase family protein [Clostridium saccharoperbutylacetonicum]|uniref:lactonase family protein n=1 Tax=Clostridium saccharoperbutylacetonicum TaxID=36745 RepID=UPI000983EAF1|nr:lactonase family protein [Clostridium saccharoperbutylacetonicum]AQR97378.1 6-phosphogluconolactonase [Clostridium saccharoperbutylacetonicum]NSB33262.1 6-phosphogluconolactonase [Clostridium saccharoperbutylacetonicum]